jgi:hypothetical protein
MANRKVRTEVQEATVVVGWTHWTTPSGIRLNIQTTRSRAAFEQGEIETRQILLTRNQSLLLAKYLVDVTQQELPKRRRGNWHQRLAAFLR